MNAPLYTRRTCAQPVSHLQWHYAVDWWGTPLEPTWLPELQKHCATDRIQVLSCAPTGTLQSTFVVQSPVSMSPAALVQRLRGRLQALLRPFAPKALTDRDLLESVGNISADAIDAFVQGQRQLSREPTCKPAAATFSEYRWQDARVNLGQPQVHQNRPYWYNLHLFLTYAEIDCHLTQDQLSLIWSSIRQIAERRQHALKLAELSATTIHCYLRGRLSESPEQIALSYLNGFAAVLGQSRAFHNNYWVTTQSPVEARGPI